MKIFFQDLDWKCPSLVPLSALFGFLLSPVWPIICCFLCRIQSIWNFFCQLTCCVLLAKTFSYIINKLFCKYLLHTWATRKSWFKGVFYGQKAKSTAKTLQQNQTDLILLQRFCSIFFAAKIEFAAIFNWWVTCSILYSCTAQHFFAACGWKMQLVSPDVCIYVSMYLCM